MLSISQSRLGILPCGLFFLAPKVSNIIGRMSSSVTNVTVKYSIEKPNSNTPQILTTLAQLQMALSVELS